ncbi:MAG TPA: alpha-galactosidase [Bacteroidales bacterium]|nr:alpha-galactosidase [Bacteroidales bacterium]
MKVGLYLIFLFSIVSGISPGKESCGSTLEKKGKPITVRAGILKRELVLNDSGIVNSTLSLAGEKVAYGMNGDFSFTLWKAFPDVEPEGIGNSSASGVEQSDAVKNNTDALNVEVSSNKTEQSVSWIDSVSLQSRQIFKIFDSRYYSRTSSGNDKDRLTLSFKANKNLKWKGLTLDIVYETYQGYPVIRKWVRLSNSGLGWIKISDLVLDPVRMLDSYSFSAFLTPAVRGMDPCIMALSDSARSQGIIQVSEAPSKVRSMSGSGFAGYNRDYFEWVIGPGESFESEPVFIYAFSGKSYPTMSSVSTALDRCVESEFREFMKKYILMPFDTSKIVAPLFCTWTNYSANINDDNMREATTIASDIGFRCFQLDAGWSDTGPLGGWAVSSRNPDQNKFRDLTGLSKLINSKGMKTGLWYSVFINEKQAETSGELRSLCSLPLIRRSGGLGVSFACQKARDKYVSDIVFLNKTYNARYFKQDLSDICYGDIAYGHESRTRKESYLRGLRGLFDTQDMIHQAVPDIFLQMSHEIYWETPGPAADVAVLKHVDSYHISPNEYWGAGNRSKPVDSGWNFKPDSLSSKLIQGCLSARTLMYAHRGLPLERLEVFGAVTTNYNGSLSVDIQDRQICSWLVGTPLSFSGDLGSLTQENIERYRSRFAIVNRLQQTYGIYSFFQYSGVPAPTDSGWHWWGKLNEEGCGIVIVLRGSDGDDSRKINIPWVTKNKKYLLKGLLSEKDMGVFTGKQLQNGELVLFLKRFGQEMIEITLQQ